MKRTILVLAVAVMLAAFAAPILAQNKDCTDENKGAWYQKFLDNRKGEAPQQKIAYDAAKDYLTCATDKTEQIPQYLQKWVDQYDKVMGTQAVNKQFEDAYKQKNYPDQIRLGRQVLTSDPDNPAVTIIMGLAGLGDAALLNDSAESAKKAIGMIESGKPFAPLASKDQALAFLNYVVAKSLLKNAPADAIPYLLKSARYDSDLKKNPQLYLDLAAAYNDGPRAKQSEDYKVYLGKPESPESKLALANINQIIERQIDALARATALADAANKKTIMDALTEEYKGLKKTDAGLNELVASVLSKPLPDVPTPLTSLPSTPSSTPATSGSPTSGNGGAPNGINGSANKAGTDQNKTGSATASGTGSAKPAPSPTPANKKPRSNHRRG